MATLLTEQRPQRVLATRLRILAYRLRKRLPLVEKPSAGISSQHGYPTDYYPKQMRWVWQDTGQPIERCPRPCSLCKRKITPGEPDPCMGYVPGIKAACCGHGEIDFAYAYTEERERYSWSGAIIELRERKPGVCAEIAACNGLA